MNTSTRLRADARNRTLRTFLQALAIDVLVAVALLVSTELSDVNGWGDLEWTVLSFMLAKTVAVSVASYLMRAFVDGSRIPTPLPPTPQPAPAEPA